MWLPALVGLPLIPVLACLVPIGHSLMRGQTNLLVLALLCGTLAAAFRRRSLLAGLCLSGAICIKIYPAFSFSIHFGDATAVGWLAASSVWRLDWLRSPWRFRAVQDVALYQELTDAVSLSGPGRQFKSIAGQRTD